MSDSPRDYFVHSSAVIDEPTEIGAGSKIWHFTHVMRDAVLGQGCILGQNVFVASRVTLGNNVKVQNNVSLYTGVICEDDVFLGPSMVFTNVINPRSHVERKDEFKTTLVKRGASIGANATIVCGSTIGRYALVGAGSVVTHDVPDYTVVYGIPARIRGAICACGESIEFDADHRATCYSCGASYERSETGTILPTS